MTKFKTIIVSPNNDVKIIESDDKLADENFGKNVKSSNIFINPKNKALLGNFSSMEKDSFPIDENINKIKIKKKNFMCENSTYRTYIIEQGGTGGAECSVDNFDIDMASESLSYVGYGVPDACKILKIETLSGCTYTSLWSEGNELLDKKWDNRETYSYF